VEFEGSIDEVDRDRANRLLNELQELGQLTIRKARFKFLESVARAFKDYGDGATPDFDDLEASVLR
jgi:hypothetical protein